MKPVPPTEHYVLEIPTDRGSGIQEALYSGDGNEAVMVGSCSCRGQPRATILRLQSARSISGSSVVRAPDFVEWWLGEAKDFIGGQIRLGRRIAFFHSHPTGVAMFSPQDDRADQMIGATLRREFGPDQLCLSVIVLSDGHMTARLIGPLDFCEIAVVLV